VDENFDCADLDSASNEEDHIYDKTFLPGIEKTFTRSGQDDYLTLDTRWGKFGFMTCYDMCFTQIFQEYAMFEKVDAVIQIASWRATGERNYEGMDVQTDRYYGFIWDLMASSQAAFNQYWVIACNSVGYQEKGDYLFWGGSGLWSPSGIELLQGSHEQEELLVIHHIDILGETQYEQDDFHYYKDFIEVYELIPEKRAFTRTKQ
jgi:predicted amidohydrolase